jgi:endonuclease III
MLSVNSRKGTRNRHCKDAAVWKKNSQCCGFSIIHETEIAVDTHFSASNRIGLARTPEPLWSRNTTLKIIPKGLRAMHITAYSSWEKYMQGKKPLCNEWFTVVSNTIGKDRKK